MLSRSRRSLPPLLRRSRGSPSSSFFGASASPSMAAREFTTLGCLILRSLLSRFFSPPSLFPSPSLAGSSSSLLFVASVALASSAVFSASVLSGSACFFSSSTGFSSSSFATAASCSFSSSACSFFCSFCSFSLKSICANFEAVSTAVADPNGLDLDDDEAAALDDPAVVRDVKFKRGRSPPPEEPPDPILPIPPAVELPPRLHAEPSSAPPPPRLSYPEDAPPPLLQPESESPPLIRLLLYPPPPEPPMRSLYPPPPPRESPKPPPPPPPPRRQLESPSDREASRSSISLRRGARRKAPSSPSALALGPEGGTFAPPAALPGPRNSAMDIFCPFPILLNVLVFCMAIFQPIYECYVLLLGVLSSR
mmetsp:Transcript_26463/g.43674  ORF Transcript_26463/g.43674 Transcript_26463/m.43674 type:complete len:366 (-) Transcript_26463:54-1151(-)